MNEYTNELKKIFKNSELEKSKLKSEFVNTEHFILSILNFKTNIKEILNSYNIFYDNYKDEILKLNLKKVENSTNVYSTEFKSIIENADSYIKTKNRIIDTNMIFLSMLEDEENNGVIILKNMSVDLNELYKQINNNSSLSNNLYINDIGISLNEEYKKGNLDKVIGREKEINNIIEILLRKNKNNPLLIGEAGVGKTAIVEELASRIENKEVPSSLYNIKIYSVSMASLVAGTKYRGEFEEKLSKIIKEVESNKDIVLFVDEIHTLVGAGGAEGAIDASNILKPSLSRGNIRLIGATTIKEYKKFIAPDKALDRRFQKIYIDEPTLEETYNILKKIKKTYEEFHNVIISKEILNLIPKYTRLYLPNKREPDASIDILDEICAKAIVNNKNSEYEKLIKEKNRLHKIKKDSIIKEDYKKALKIREEELLIEKKLNKLKSKTNIKEVNLEILKNVLEEKSNSVILELETKKINEIKRNVKKQIVGQDNAIEKIFDVILSKNIELKSPMMISLYGGIGSGRKSTIIKIFKELKYNIIKLDSSEFSNEISVNKILGSTQGYIGYNENNTIFESVKDKPNTLVLITNYDKFSDNVKEIIKNIKNNGKLKLSNEETIFFRNTFFIFIEDYKYENIGFNHKHIENEEKSFIDEKIYFNDITKIDVKNYILNYYKQNNIIINETEIEEIIDNCEYKTNGLKKVNRLLKEKIKSYE